jgi:hypothetical protein
MLRSGSASFTYEEQQRNFFRPSDVLVTEGVVFEAHHPQQQEQVWKILAEPAMDESTSAATAAGGGGAGGSSSSSSNCYSSVVGNVAFPEMPGTGLFSLLLSRRAGRAVSQLALDVAGLPVPPQARSLLPGELGRVDASDVAGVRG